MVTQVVSSEEPQRLLRRGSCVFSRVYKAFCEGLFEAKLFLTSALHQPTMQLIMDDEWYLDIDPNKVRRATLLAHILARSNVYVLNMQEVHDDQIPFFFNTPPPTNR